MDWRVEKLVILAGGLGMVVGAALATAAEPLAGGVLAASLLLLGLAAWHFWAWGLGKLIAVGLLAAGVLLIRIVDELVARRLLVASAAVVLLGVLWSFVELYRRERERSEELAASLAWWRKWGMLVVGIAVALAIGWQVNTGSEDEDAPPIDTADEDDERVVLDDEWSITPDGAIAGNYIFSMIKTFSPLEEADVEDLGGRFAWPEAELDLCDVNIWGVGDGFVQIGIISSTTEGCPGMLPAFVDFGVPQTACLFVRSGGSDDEYCAPLAVG